MRAVLNWDIFVLGLGWQYSLEFRHLKGKVFFFFFNFLKIFLMAIFKIFIEYVTILPPFSWLFLVTRHVGSEASGWTHTPSLKGKVCTTGPIGKSWGKYFKSQKFSFPKTNLDILYIVLPQAPEHRKMKILSARDILSRQKEAEDCTIRRRRKEKRKVNQSFLCYHVKI